MEQGAPDPQPLRSEQYPWGLPWLRGLDLARVRSANRIYSLAIATIGYCIREGILWSCENPENSYMWSIPGFIRILEAANALKVVYDGCMLGGKRQKSSMWATNASALSSLAPKCDGQHPHLSW